ncbi:hypothetical protein Q7P37_011326 [Cladosporium fusiforme]
MPLFQTPFLDHGTELLDSLLQQPASKMRALFLATFTAAAATSQASAPTTYHTNPGVLQHVNPRIGTSGTTPNGNGGMIPSVSPPFGMTRWTAQTRENFISQCPYNDLDAHIHGFQATHQPAIWMGESGQVVLVPGLGEVRPLFEERARAFGKGDERVTPYVYEVEMDAEMVTAGKELTESVFSPVPGGAQEVPEEVEKGAGGRVRRDGEGGGGWGDTAGRLSRQGMRGDYGKYGKGRSKLEGKIKVAMTASSHVGHLRCDFPRQSSQELNDPYVFIQATRQNWTGSIAIDPEAQEISGSNPQRQDYALGPYRAPNFSGYFVSRFSKPFVEYGVTRGGELFQGAVEGQGEHLGAWARFDSQDGRVEVRTGVSFVSVEQARRNLDIEAPASVSFDDAVETLKEAWLEKLDRVQIEGVNETAAEYDQKTIFYTGLFHGLQYPSDFSEPLETIEGGRRTWYEGYTDQVREGEDSYYQSWSIWDTFRAEHSLLTFFAPERVNSMMRSLLRIYDWSGRLPVWANIVETNIMIGTHVDAVIANALERNFTDFDVGKAWEAVKKNAYEPPINDTELLYYDREAYTPDEVRAGLTAYKELGYVPNDQWAESGSRTLDYAFDDYAASIVATHARDEKSATDLLARSKNYRNIFNANTTFMQARNANGTWADPAQGWTEGDAWIYTFNVPHDPAGLVSLFGSAADLKAKLDAYFSSGQNDHSNEPSHHSPYMYAAIGYPSATQNLTRAIAAQNYNATAAGLSGNEDLGQMSAWFVFSALGFYPVNPAGDEYIVGAPFFEKVTVRFPAGVATGGVGGGGERGCFQCSWGAGQALCEGFVG